MADTANNRQCGAMDRNDLLRKIAALKNELQPLLNQYHGFLAKIKNEKGEDRAFTAAEHEEAAKMGGDIERLNASLTSAKAALKAFDACDEADRETAQDLGLSNVADLPHASDQYRERFHNVLSGGFNAADTAALASMVGTSDRFQNLTGTLPSTGSVLIPTELEKAIYMEAASNSPLLTISGRLTLSGRINALPFIADGGIMAPREEGEAYVLSEPALTAKTVKVYNFGKFFPVANELMQDAPALEAMFGELFGRSFAETVEEYGLKGASGQTAFTDMSGNAVALTLANKVPTGILPETTANVAELETAAVGAVGLDDILKLPFEIVSSAEGDTAWLVSKEFLQNAVLLKDTTGRPIWMPALSAGRPSTLLGAPLHRSDRLGAIAASAFPAIYGNFKSGHKIVLRKGLTISKSEHFLFGNNMTAIKADVRFGAAVTLKKYLARLKVKA